MSQTLSAKIQERYEQGMNAPVIVKPINFTEKSIDWIFKNDLKSWRGSFMEIDASSWIILDKAILTRLPLSETKEEPNDYVDRQEGFIYRIRELGDHEARPTKTTDIPDQGPVRVNHRPRDAWDSWSPEYCIGSAGYLKFALAKADATHLNCAAREHENIEYAASRGPNHFRVPRVVYHLEAGGKYCILTERVGAPFLDRPIPATHLNRLLDQMVAAVVEMAQWEAPSVQGVNGKDINHWMVPHVISTIFGEGRRACDCLQRYLQDKGFTMKSFCFLNANISLASVGLDQDFNLVGFNDWESCAFVPKGYIMPFVLHHIEYLNPPIRLDDLPQRIRSARRSGAGRLSLEMFKRGLPNEMGLYDELVYESLAKSLAILELNTLGVEFERAWIFPDNDPFYRPEVLHKN